MADRIHTMVADTVSTVTIAKGPKVDEIEVLNVDGAAEIRYRLGRAPEDMADPTVDAVDADIEVLPAAVCARVHKVATSARTVVKLISDGTPTVSVKGR